MSDLDLNLVSANSIFVSNPEVEVLQQKKEMRRCCFCFDIK